ncbi:MAG: FAD-dependent monooxygenase [Acidobacteria bacterium]|nr:FAD-dependent monooxygenase [Acidobacteriota bacterium]
MSERGPRHYDVAIVGAGPVGSLCALAHAREAARVVLLEANSGAPRRLAGEWLHPPAVETLRDFGVELASAPDSTMGRGFVVFPEDGADPIMLPYPGSSVGLACEHAVIVSSLHEAVAKEPGIDFLLGARVRAIEGERLTFTRDGAAQSVTASRIVGADGRSSVVRRSLGLSTSPMTCSLMVGVLLEDVQLPVEGYGHMLCGGPGPILIYPLGGERVRVLLDVPQERWAGPDRMEVMASSCGALMPEALRPSFVQAVRSGDYSVAANGVKPRISYGAPRRVLVGDAAGHYHPLTGVGMTLGFGDALALAESGDFGAFTRGRVQATRAPELLAMGVYEAFADGRDEAVFLRQAVYRGWRAGSGFRYWTTRLLACEDTSTVRLGFSFALTVVRGIVAVVRRSYEERAWTWARATLRSLLVRLWWLWRGFRLAYKARGAGGGGDERARRILARAFLVSMRSGTNETGPSGDDADVDPVKGG